MSLIKDEKGTGIVIEIYSNRVVLLKQTTACIPVTQKDACDSGCHNCSGIVSDEKVIIKCKPEVTLKKNDIVNYQSRTFSGSVTALILFGFPILSTLITAGIWLLNKPEEVESPFAVITIILSFFAGFVFVWLAELFLQSRYPSSIIPIHKNNNPK
jgi:hypothetical protein